MTTQSSLSVIVRAYFRPNRKLWRRRWCGLLIPALVAVWLLAPCSHASFAASEAVVEGCAQTSDSDRRIAACTQIINGQGETAQNQAMGYNNRGMAYRAKGDLDRAIADYNEAIRLDPQDAADFNNRGVAYGAKGDLDRAIADYNEAIRLDPKYATALRNRGGAYGAKRDLDRAIADYNEAIRLDPKYAGTFNDRGVAYRAKGELDRAIADHSEAIRLDPKYAGAFTNRGVAYGAKGDLDRAIADYNEAIRLDPEYSAAFNNRGVAYRAKGDLDRAIGDYNEAIRLDPRVPQAYYNRGVAWETKNDLKKALADYKKFAELNPSDPDGPAAIARVAKAAVDEKPAGSGSVYVAGAVRWPGDKAQFLLSDGTYIRYDLRADRADKGYPQPVDDQTWPGLGPYARLILAACNGPEGKVYFFLSNGQYLRYDIGGDKIDRGYPKPIDDTSWPGLGRYSGALSSALTWKDGKIQFFLTNGQYIRYDVKADRADPGYPKAIDDGSWAGLAEYKNLLAGMFNRENGKAYIFLKDGRYVRYDVEADRVDPGYPKAIDEATWPGMGAALGSR